MGLEAAICVNDTDQNEFSTHIRAGTVSPSVRLIVEKTV